MVETDLDKKLKAYRMLGAMYDVTELKEQERKGLKKYLEMQLCEAEIENKYFLSIKLGYDCGINKALQDYISNGHAKAFEKNFVSHIKDIVKLGKNELENILKEAHNGNLDRLHVIIGDSYK